MNESSGRPGVCDEKREPPQERREERWRGRESVRDIFRQKQTANAPVRSVNRGKRHCLGWFGSVYPIDEPSVLRSRREQNENESPFW